MVLSRLAPAFSVSTFAHRLRKMRMSEWIVLGEVPNCSATMATISMWRVPSIIMLSTVALRLRRSALGFGRERS